MAVKYDRDNNTFSHIGVPFNYTRGNPLPLDNSSVWTSREAAQTYAKVSPVAYVGQILTVVDEGKSCAETFVIKNEVGDLQYVGQIKNAYKNISKLRPYLYAVDYDEIDTDFAASYAETTNGGSSTGCSVVRNGNFIGRNLDFTYSEAVGFVVNVSSTPTRHASIGVVGGDLRFTRKLVESKEYSDLYKILPFAVTDGINDAGVFVAINSLPSGDKGSTTGTHPDAEESVCVSHLCRYILDNFSSAKTAVNFVKSNINVFAPVVDGKRQEAHVFVSDDENSYVLEFIGNEAFVVDASGTPWMTNFHMNGVTVDAVSKKVDYTTSGVSKHGRGIERWNVIADKFSSSTSISKMMKLMTTDLLGTNMYDTSKLNSQPGVDGFWYSDYTGDHTGDGYADITLSMIVDDISQATDYIQHSVATHINRSRDPENENYGSIQTMHTAVYDVALRKVCIIAQEEGTGCSMYFTLKDASKDRNHSHNFADTWTVNSTVETIDGLVLSPKVVDDVFGWSGDDDVTRLYYSNGKWNLATGIGVANVSAAASVRELVMADFPYDGDTTVLFRHESSQLKDRFVTFAELGSSGGGGGSSPETDAEITELYKRLGSGFYRLTADTTYQEDGVYFLKSGNKFRLAVKGTDYTVGDTITANTVYYQYTWNDLTKRVELLEANTTQKATTLAGYGITDAALTGDDADSATITLGERSITVGSKSYVDGLVSEEKTRATGAETALSNRLTTAEARLATRVTAYTSDTETLTISMNAPESRVIYHN